jgi:hypothetical protein
MKKRVERDDTLTVASVARGNKRLSNRAKPVSASPEVGKIARGCYSSTAMRYFTDNCPAALNFYKQGKPQSTEHFQVGIAAHSVLQVIGEKKAIEQKAQECIVNAVVKELITTGRKYYDEWWPPMSPEHAYAGRDLALQYLAQNQLPENAKYEIVLCMDKQGRPSNFENARYRAIIDCIYDAVEGDDDFAYNVIVVRDYKSAWNADEDELETLQRKSQAVLAAMHFPNKQGVRMEVVNIRTGKVYAKVIYFDDAGKEQIARWRRDILMLCDAADKTSKARPGIGCRKCPFIESCPDAEKLATSAKNAEALAVINAKRENLITLLKSQLDDVDGIRIADGYIGFKNLPANVVADEAPYQILGMWFDRQLDDVPHSMPREVGLLRAMKPGATQIENIAKQLFSGDGKIEREDFISLCLRKTTRREFGVWSASKEELDRMNLISLNGRAKKIISKKASPKKKTKKRRR